MSGGELPAAPGAAPPEPAGAPEPETVAADSRTVRLIEAVLFSAAEPVRESERRKGWPTGATRSCTEKLRSLYEKTRASSFTGPATPGPFAPRPTWETR